MPHTNTISSPIDIRDIPFLAKVLPEDFKPSIDLRAGERVEDQELIGACAGHGVTSVSESLLRGFGKIIELSRLFQYTSTKRYRNRLDGVGVIPRDALKVASKWGICQESDYGYDTTLE